jgi:hypothetical protein
VIGFVHWLFDATPFESPAAGGGWTDRLADATIVSNFSIVTVYLAIPIMILAAASRRNGFALVLDKRITQSFVIFIFTAGLTHLMRAASFWWPAYRLQVAINLLAAVTSWVAVAFMVPFVTRQISDPVLQGLPQLYEELKSLRANLREMREKVERKSRDQEDKINERGDTHGE